MTVPPFFINPIWLRTFFGNLGKPLFFAGIGFRSFFATSPPSAFFAPLYLPLSLFDKAPGLLHYLVLLIQP
jgi:hypothetical protein